MKSYYVKLTDIGHSELAAEEINIEDLSDNEAIISSEYSLISAGTELSRAYGLKKGFSYPVRPGYSLVGTVIKKGKDIEAEIGERVFANAPHASIVRWKNEDDVQGPLILRLPSGLDPKAATFINLGLVALQGVNLSEVKAGFKVGVFGLGSIGILTAMIYKKLGCRVIGFDPVESRCRLAEELGLENTISSDYQEKISELTEDKGFDICVDASGLSNVIIDCINYTKRYGQVILLGSPRVSFECDITPVFSAIHMKDLKVIGAFNNTVPVKVQNGSDDSMMRNFEIICDLFINGDIRVEKLISSLCDPKECEKAYYNLMYDKENYSSIIFDWSAYR